jgi:hypothetical protein
MIVLEPNSGVMADLSLFELTTCQRCAVWLSDTFKHFKWCPVCRTGRVVTRSTLAPTEAHAKLSIHLSVLTPYIAKETEARS